MVVNIDPANFLRIRMFLPFIGLFKHSGYGMEGCLQVSRTMSKTYANSLNSNRALWSFHPTALWFVRVIQISSTRPSHPVLSSIPVTDWKKPRKGQRMRWQLGMRKCIAKLGDVGVSRLLGWSPSITWLKTLKDITVNCRQWRSCGYFLSDGEYMRLNSYTIQCVGCHDIL